MNVHMASVGHREVHTLLQVQFGGSRRHWTLVEVHQDGVGLQEQGSV
jgi:hypothetical protein